MRSIGGLRITGSSGSVDIEKNGCDLIMANTSHKKIAIVSCVKGLNLDSSRIEFKIFLVIFILLSQMPTIYEARGTSTYFQCSARILGRVLPLYFNVFISSLAAPIKLEPLSEFQLHRTKNRRKAFLNEEVGISSTVSMCTAIQLRRVKIAYSKIW